VTVDHVTIREVALRDEVAGREDEPTSQVGVGDVRRRRHLHARGAHALGVVADGVKHLRGGLQDAADGARGHEHHAEREAGEDAVPEQAFEHDFGGQRKLERPLVEPAAAEPFGDARNRRQSGEVTGLDRANQLGQHADFLERRHSSNRRPKDTRKQW
jgi:hypothetical protein